MSVKSALDWTSTSSVVSFPLWALICTPLSTFVSDHLQICLYQQQKHLNDTRLSTRRRRQASRPKTEDACRPLSPSSFADCLFWSRTYTCTHHYNSPLAYFFCLTFTTVFNILLQLLCAYFHFFCYKIYKLCSAKFVLHLTSSRSNIKPYSLIVNVLIEFAPIGRVI